MFGFNDVEVAEDEARRAAAAAQVYPDLLGEQGAGDQGDAPAAVYDDASADLADPTVDALLNRELQEH
eukprot:14335403-Alexandrium_andersonii.AAC.1